MGDSIPKGYMLDAFNQIRQKQTCLFLITYLWSKTILADTYRGILPIQCFRLGIAKKLNCKSRIKKREGGLSQVIVMFKTCMMMFPHTCISTFLV